MEYVEDIEGIFKLNHNIEHVFFKNFFNQKLLSNDLGHTHIITLIILEFDGPSPMSIISEKLNLEKGSFTPVAKKLINRGLIEKCRDKVDKRIFRISLTSEGQRYAKECIEEHHRFMNELLNALSEEEKVVYFEAINQILKMTKKIESGVKYK